MFKQYDELINSWLFEQTKLKFFGDVILWLTCLTEQRLVRQEMKLGHVWRSVFVSVKILCTKKIESLIWIFLIVTFLFALTS